MRLHDPFSPFRPENRPPTAWATITMAYTTEKIPEKPKRINLRRWNRKIFWTIIGLVALELLLVVPFLTLIGIADPNTYRTKLWEDGYEQTLFQANIHILTCGRLAISMASIAVPMNHCTPQPTTATRLSRLYGARRKCLPMFSNRK